MNLTVNHLIQTVFKEFSKHRVERFTMKDLAQIADISRSSIYRYFDCIDYVYKEVFERLILKEITQDCQSSDELIERFVNYVHDNETFCLNLYYRTALMLRTEHIIKVLNELIFKYDQKDHSDKWYMIGGFICTLEDWFNGNLKRDKQLVINDLLSYNSVIKSVC
ncbi:TetR/AcrR family transcriptional regulator [Companilactobacillus kimchiensis]|nr:TetR/AcrR family transcriptional regulator [Companilactobacillus kimchiensis]